MSCFNPQALAEAQSDTFGLQPLKDSRAYEQYVKRGDADLSKLIYLIDRFEEGKFQILYDKLYYNPRIAATFARWFLKRRYKEQKPKEWVMQWCNASIFTGSLVWVKLPDGKFRLSRKVLFDELKALEEMNE
ncbi:MAG: hypothetical protein Q8R76_03330 [Candidatus Omnitrophota bacterium]|nr:hypothetical protein [Candidatus Omnitrophota bacterium]